MIVKLVMYFGHPVAVACDARCDKAWGINTRPRRQLSPDEDDYEFLADGELGTAPADPGTSEGVDSKPRTPDQRMNRWCVRECERHVWAGMNERSELPDFSRPLPNKHARRTA